MAMMNKVAPTSAAATAAGEHEYRFDAKLFAQFTVRGPNRKEARKKIEDFLNGAIANFGELDGGTITASVSLDDDGVDLLEVDGEPV